MHCSNCHAGLPDDASYCPACGHPVAGRAAGTRAGGTPTWLKLVVVVVVFFFVLGFCGIISAIAIPNLLNAIDRGKQKRTMADMRTLSGAVEQHAEEHRAYPVAGDFETLLRLLPRGPEPLPSLDGWGRPFAATSDGSTYELRSGGKDGVFDGCPGGPKRNFNDDICFADSRFTQWPEGTQL